MQENGVAKFAKHKYRGLRQIVFDILVFSNHVEAKIYFKHLNNFSQLYS